MIKRWKLFNFKSVRKETEIEFAPLTIFAGPNSSGKSTLLQSILLVAQTLAHKVSSRSVVLNGAFSQLGQFDDLKSVDSDADQIVIGWQCGPPSKRLAEALSIGMRRIPPFFIRGKQSIANISCEIAFDTKASVAEREIAQIQPSLFSSLLAVLTRDPESGDRRFEINLRRTTIQDDESKRDWFDAEEANEPLVRRSLQYDVELDEHSLQEIHEELASAQPVGCVLRHFLPEQLALGVDMVIEDAHSIFNMIAGEGLRSFSRGMHQERHIEVPAPVVEHCLEILSASGIQDDSVRSKLSRLLEAKWSLFGRQPILLDQFHNALSKLRPSFQMEFERKLSGDAGFEKLIQDSVQELRKERKKEPAVLMDRTPAAITKATIYLEQFFGASVRYLGPLRDEPKSLYPLSPTADPSDVGLRGEHTAAVLELHKNHQVRYVPPTAFAEPEVKLKTVNRSLEHAVVDWLRYLSVAEHIESRDKGKFGHELNVSIAGSKDSHDLTHVGVGVSQVLPILVSSLLAAPDTTLIFEQPELHLHPKVQTLLADFFLSMTQLGKQCLVETHSEYIINRIRFRAAAAINANPWLEAVKMYFVEKAQQESTFREISINEFGAINEWPEGFFDQSQRETEGILRAAASKRKAKRRKKQ